MGKAEAKGAGLARSMCSGCGRTRSTVAQRLGCVRWKSRTGRWRSRFSSLEEELEGLAAREKKILGRVAAEMDTMQAEINRLRLSTQLNSNALDRILRQPEPESAEKENDSQES